MLTNFYNTWQVGTQCTELIVNIAVIDLPTMYCYYTTLGKKSSA